jgi:hypothetical protein
VHRTRTRAFQPIAPADRRRAQPCTRSLAVSAS